MPDNIVAIEKIKPDNNKQLFLARNIVGADLYETMQDVFNAGDLHLEDVFIDPYDPSSNSLTLKGKITSLGTWKDVNVELCLSDLKSTSSDSVQRHGVFQFELPKDLALDAFLAQVSAGVNPDAPPEEPAETMMDYYVKTIDFAATNVSVHKLLLSSLDGDEAGFEQVYPADFKPIMPASVVKKGLNFPLELAIDEDIRAFFEQIFGDGFMTSAQCQGLVYRDDPEASPRFMFSWTINAGPTVGPLSLTLEQIGLSFPLAEDGSIWPQVLLSGSVEIKTRSNAASFAITAAFDLYYEELAITFKDFPPLRTWVELAELDDYFPDVFQPLLKITLSELRLVINLSDRSLSEVSLSLTTDTELVLMENEVLSIKTKPTLDLQIYAPFDADYRSIEGVLRGDWHLGENKFITSMTYPDFSLYAAMAEGTKLDTTDLVKEILAGIEPPRITFTGMELQGSYTDKSFSIDLEVGNVWELELGSADKKLTIADIQMGLLYVDGASYGLSGVITLPVGKNGSNVNVYVSAEYESGSGWQFEGSTGPGQQIAIDPLIKELASMFKVDADLPEAVKDLTISNLGVAFNTKSKDFTFTCESSFKVDVQEVDISLAIELTKQATGAYRKHFGGQITIGGLRFDLVFDKSTGSSTFIATYRNLYGDSIKVKDLVENISSALADDIPDDLKITLNEALFVKTGSNGKTGNDDKSGNDDKPGSDILFALAVSARLDDLPLIGGYLEGDELKLGVRVVVSNNELDNNKVQAINALLPDGIGRLTEAKENKGATPKPINKGFNLEAMLDLGSMVLTLPASSSYMDSSSGNGAAPAAPDAVDAPASQDISPTAAAPESEVNWVALQRSFGPLYFARIGMQYKAGEITLLLDTSIAMAALKFSLVGLGVRSRLKPFDPHLQLEGLGLSYRKDPVEIEGIFLRTLLQDGSGDNKALVPSEPEYEYVGAAVIKAKTFSISAFGAYRDFNGQPSMFLYAVLDKTLGGPSFFYVTGLALGFGFNRDLRVPGIAGVRDFPLISAAAAKPAASQPGGAGGKQENRPDLAMMGKLRDSIPAKIGSYWIAAGVRFSSFQIIDSFALLLVKFGQELDIVLMGLSTMQLPKDKSLPAYLYAELQFKVSVKPAEGVFRAEAQLTENSYVIDKQARLTGGFALYVWFNGPRKGDFVLTLGGYHPRFNVPAHYPRVPPLAISWPVSDKLSIKGTAYFALTPSCIMAGGSLEVTYQTSVVKADFIARANFLISWKPFFYDIDLSLSLHVRATLNVLIGTITMETSLSAALHIWGPEFAGTAHISWSFISFDIAFGAAAKPSFKKLSWDEFNQAFLPQPAENNPHPICQISLASGMLCEIVAEKTGEKEWVVLGEALQFTTETFIPASVIEVEGSLLDPIEGKEIGFRPMGNGQVISRHQVAVSRLGPGPESKLSDWVFTDRRQGVPKELWDTVNDEKPPTPSAEILPNRLVGMDSLRPADKGSGNSSPVFDLTTFAFDMLDEIELPLAQHFAEDIPDDDGSAYSDQDAFSVIETTAMEGQVTNFRIDIFKTARDTGFPLEEDIGTLDVLVAKVGTSFQAKPMLGVLGSTGSRPPSIPKAAPIPPPQVEVPVIKADVRLQAQLFQYAYVSPEGASETAIGATILPPHPEKAEQTLTAESKAEDAYSHTLTAGQSLAWDIKHDVPEGQDEANAVEPELLIHHRDGGRVRVVMLDKYGGLLKDETMAGQAGERVKHNLHGAGQVLATGLAGAERGSSTVGWHGSSAMIQMRPRVFLGDEVLVRAQASRQRRAASESGLDLVSGEALAAQNLTASGDEEERSGWLRTFLPGDGGYRTLAVVLKRSQIPAATGPMTAVSVTSAGGEHLRLQPVHLIRESAAEYVLLYALPVGLKKEGASGAHVVETEATAGWQIHGVLAMPEPVGRVRANWAAFRLKPTVIAGEEQAAMQAAEPARVQIVRSEMAGAGR